MFSLFRRSKKNEEKEAVRKEIAEAKDRSHEQRLLVRDAIEKLAKAKGRKQEDD